MGYFSARDNHLREMGAITPVLRYERAQRSTKGNEMTDTARNDATTVSLIMQDVVDLEYDTCDESQPDLMHVTYDELEIILRRHILGAE